MRQVISLLQFQRETRQGDWLLHLASLERLCVYFFAYNRHDYAQNIPEYIARMNQLKIDDSQTWDKFMAGDFTVSATNQVPFTRLGVDQAQEHVNKKLKGQGAVNGITQSSSTLLKFCLCAPELARISGEIENVVELPEHRKKQQHHSLNTSVLERQEKAIEKLHKVLKPCRIFQSDELHMFKLMSKEIVPKNVEESILSMEERGTTALQSFVDDRICGDKNLWEKMTKSKYLTWSSTSKSITLAAKSDIITVRATVNLMSRLLIIARSSRAVDLEEVIGCYELSTTNRTLMKADGSLLPTTGKSIVIALLEELVPQNLTYQLNENGNDVFSKKCRVIDVMAVVQEISAVRNFESCKELGAAIVKLINFKARGYDVTRVIFDNYSVENPMKDATRERRRGSKSIVKVYKVDDNTKIKSMKQFLASSVTKDSLTLYLSQVLIEHANAHIITATQPSCSVQLPRGCFSRSEFTGRGRHVDDTACN